MQRGCQDLKEEQPMYGSRDDFTMTISIVLSENAFKGAFKKLFKVTGYNMVLKA